jgi:hypothetical protein
MSIMRQMMRLSSSKVSSASTSTSTSVVEAKKDIAIPSLAVVVLEKGKARLFQDGNPIVYGGAVCSSSAWHFRSTGSYSCVCMLQVKEIKGDPKMSDEVLVTDHYGNEIGRGVFNPISTYRVRILSRNFEPEFRYSMPGNLLSILLSVL